MRTSRTIVGRYELCAELASGGMGRVYLAKVRGLAGVDKVVALKCIHPELAGEQRFVEMFLDEARIAARLTHPNVCSVYEFGEADGRYFLAMEYLEGESLARLARVLAQRTPRSPDLDVLMAFIVAQAAEGLHAAHSLVDEEGHPLDVVHRDVSPHNLFVTYDGGVRVVDFGIASARGRLHETTTGSVKGKFAYMSPEQMRREPVDRRSDVWSLGVVLWELLTSQRMRAEESEVDVILGVLNDPVRSPLELRPDLDADLHAIVMRALAKPRDERTPTARELAQSLQQWIVGRGAVVGRSELAALMARTFPEGRAARRQLLDAARADATTDGGALHLPLLEARPAPRRALVAAALALGVLAVGGAWTVGALTSSPASPPRRASVAPPEPARVSARDAGSPAVEPDGGADASASADAGARARARATGVLRVETPGGWAEVLIDGERRGRTPLSIELPVGRATMELRPFGLSPPADDASMRRRLVIGARPQRVVVPLGE